MAEGIGAVYVDVRPNADNFVNELRGRIVPGMDDLGKQAGTAFADAFRGVVDKQLPEAFRRTRPTTTREGGQSGRDAGDAFGRELDTRITAAVRALPDIVIDADSSDVDEKLFIIRQQLTELSGKNIGVDLSDKEALAGLAVLRAQLDELTRPDHDVRVRVDAKAALAELAAVQAEVDKLDKTPATAKANTAGNVGILGPAIVAGITTIGPLAAVLGTGLAAAGAGAVTLALGVKGASAEMKAGTDIGKQYTGVVGQLKSDLQISEATAARSLFPSLNAAASDLQKRLPAITGEIQRIGTVGGDTGQHLTSALFGAFQAAEPLINKVFDDIDRGATKLDAWANGGGLNKFVQWGENNLPQIERDLAQIGKLAVDLLESGAGSGVAILNVLGALAKDVDWLIQHVPGSASVLADLYLGMKAFEKLGAATAALKAFTVAEAEAGAAGGAAGTLGLKARVLPLVGTAAVSLLAGNLLSQQAASQTSGLAYSNNVFARGLAGGAQIDKDLFSLHLSHLGQDLTPNAAHNADVTQQNAFNAALGQVGSGQSVLTARARGGYGTATAGNQVLAPQFQAPSVTQSPAQLATANQDAAAAADFNAAHNKAYAASVDQVTKAYGSLHQQLASTPISQAAQGYSALQTSIQANVDETDKFLSLGGRQREVYKGIAVDQNTYAAALKETNGDADAAIGLIHGQIDAITHNRDTINDLIVRQQRLGEFQTDTTSKYKLSTDQVDLYSEALGLNADKITSSNAAEAAAEAEIGAVAKQLSNASTAMGGWLTAVDAYNKAGDTAASRGQLIGQTLKAANGDLLDYANTMVQASTANQQLVTDFQGLKSGVLDLKTGTIDYHNAAAAPLLSDLSNLQTAALNAASATYQHETALHMAGAADDAFNVYVNDTKGALVDQAGQLHLTSGEAQTLADKYFGIKNAGDIKKQIELIGQDKVSDALANILSDLDKIAGVHRAEVDITVNSNTAGSLASTYNSQVPAAARIAGGGFVTGPGGPRDDMVPARLSNGEFVVNAAATDQNRQLLEAINQGHVKAFESGGFVGVSTATASSTAASKRAAAAGSALAKLHITIDDSDIPRFLHSLGGTASAIQSAETTLAKAVTSAGGGSALGRELSNENTSLLHLADSRASLANRLKTANSDLSKVTAQWGAEQAKVAGVFSGAFDITSAGYSPQQILATLGADNAQAKLFQQQLNTVRSLGLSKSLVQQFAEKGTSAEPALLALTRASGAQIAQINSGVSTLGGIGTAIGGDEANSLYGAGVNAARSLVAGLQSQDKQIAAAMTHIADTMVAQIRRALGIHSPSRVTRELGQYIGQGLALGIHDSRDDVARATAAMAGAAVPGRGIGGAGAAGVQAHFQIYGVSDPVAAATAAERRILMLAG